MTKRFILFDNGETIIDNESVADDGGKEIYWTVEYVQLVKLVELMNELHEENEQLREINEWLWKKNKEIENPKKVPIKRSC